MDLGGVVFQSTGTSNYKIRWETISKLNHKYGHDLNIGRDIFPDFMTDYNNRTNQNITGKEFLRCVFDTLEINTELINHLRQKCQIVIVSDNYRENIEYISKRYDFEKWAIKQFYSFDYGMVKSDLRFFEVLKKDLKQYSSDQMLFIDDSPNKLSSATKSGIEGILFQNNNPIFKELKSYGL